MYELIGYMNQVDDFLWIYLAFPVIACFGLYLTVRFRSKQLFILPQVLKEFIGCYQEDVAQSERGIHPLHAFFITIGGCIGVANLVTVCTAMKLGGPGAIFWMWVTAFIGMLVKYAEVYLGVKFRVPNNENSYDGGPMYYLTKAFNSKVPSYLFALMLAIYGVEVYMFKVVTISVVENFNFPQTYVIAVLLGLTLFTAHGGGKRVGQVCSWMIPGFLVIFMFMSIWALCNHLEALPGAFKLILTSAFTGHAALGGFAGSTAMMAISQGVKRACYTGDIGVGYAAVVAAESSDTDHRRQARFAILGIFIDTFIVCTVTAFLVLSTDIWSSGIDESLMVQHVLGMHFPGMQYFMPIFIFLLGYTTIIGFFHVGEKCMQFISPRYGRSVYYVYAAIVFLIFSYMDSSYALGLMNICGGCMLLLNLCGMIKLRKEISI